MDVEQPPGRNFPLRRPGFGREPRFDAPRTGEQLVGVGQQLLAEFGHEAVPAPAGGGEAGHVLGRDDDHPVEGQHHPG